MSYNPNLSYFLSRLQGVSTNYFTLQPQNTSTSITAGKIIRFSLPSNCLLNTRSLAFCFNADANQTASAGGRLPSDISTLITRIELSSGGNMIAQGANEINVFNHIKKLLTCDKCDVALGHPEIVREKSYVDGGGDYATSSTVAILATTKNENYRQDAGQQPFMIKNFESFLGSVFPTIIDTSLLSDLVLTFYLAGNEVLTSSAGPALSGTGSLDIVDVGTGTASYAIKDFSLICETLGMADSVMDNLVQSRISSVGYIELLYKTYYSFNDTHSGTTRFTIASQSLDRVWVAFRDSGYDTQKAPVVVAGHKVSGAFTSATSAGASYTQIVTQDIGKPQYDIGGMLDTNSEKYRGVYYNFKEQLSGSTPPTYQLSFNGSLIPQFKASAENMLTISRNSVPTHEMGSGLYPLTEFSLDQYKTNFFCFCVRLNLPQSEENREISGCDTRGISLNAFLQTTGFATSKNVVIFGECSSTLRISAGKMIDIIF